MASACSSKNDIVATQRSTTLHGPDGSIFLPDPTHPCEPGDYSGSLFTVPGDAGIKIQYSGRIKFSITQSPHGEFQVTDNTAQLAGTGDDGTTMFQAEIVNGECKDGVVQATLQHGKYTYFTNVDKTMTGTFDFQGTINGAYESAYTAFVGKWTTVLQIGGNYGDLTLAGSWSAARTTN